MEWTPVITASVSAFSGLTGAGLGFLSTQLAAQRNRDADRRKRCVDRLVAALEKLDNSYVAYLKDDGTDLQILAGVQLQVSVRQYAQAVQLIDIRILRDHASSYADMLKIHHLYAEAGPTDPLDEDTTIPSATSLSFAHARLMDELRHYESK